MPAKTKVSNARRKTTNQTSWTQWRIRTQMDKNWHKVILLYSGDEEYMQQSLIYILTRLFYRSHRWSECPRCIMHWLISEHSSEAQKYQLHFTNMKLKHVRDKENCHPTKNAYSQKEKWTGSSESEVSVIIVKLCPDHATVLPPGACRRQVPGWTSSMVYVASLWP